MITQETNQVIISLVLSCYQNCDNFFFWQFSFFPTFQIFLKFWISSFCLKLFKLFRAFELLKIQILIMGKNSNIFQMARRGDWPHRDPLRRRAVLPSVQVRSEVPLRVSGSDVCRRQSAHPPSHLLKRTHLPVNPHRRLESGAVSRDCLPVNHINAVFSQRKGKDRYV